MVAQLAQYPFLRFLGHLEAEVRYLELQDSNAGQFLAFSAHPIPESLASVSVMSVSSKRTRLFSTTDRVMLSVSTN